MNPEIQIPDLGREPGQPSPYVLFGCLAALGPTYTTWFYQPYISVFQNNKNAILPLPSSLILLLTPPTLSSFLFFLLMPPAEREMPKRGCGQYGQSICNIAQGRAVLGGAELLMANRQVWSKSYTEVAPQHDCAIDCVRLLARERDSVVTSKCLGIHLSKEIPDFGRRWRTGEGTIDYMGVVLHSIVAFGRSARFSWILSQARETWARCIALGGTDGPTVQRERRGMVNTPLSLYAKGAQGLGWLGLGSSGSQIQGLEVQDST